MTDHRVHPDQAPSALILKLLGIAIAIAAEIAPFSASQPEKAVYFWADYYQVSRYELYHTLEHESHFDNTKVGPYGELGVCQTYLPAHPDVTRAEALDPDWCIRWTARMFHEGHAHWWVAHWRFE